MSDDEKKTTTGRAPRKRRGKAKPTTRGSGNTARGTAKKDAAPAPSAAAQPARGDRDPAPRVPADAPPTLAVIPLHVRWRDLDAFNHVNNSSYLTYLEEARLQWLRTVPGEWFNAHSMPVMAAVELQYRKPIEWPCEIDVLLTAERLGSSSMTIGNRIVARGDHACVYAEGNVVMVWIDPATGASVPLPEAIRSACSA